MLTHRWLGALDAIIVYIFAITLIVAATPVDHDPIQRPVSSESNQQEATTSTTMPQATMEQEPAKQGTPVIGVITQVLRDYKRFGTQKHLHLPSSYVKWIESAGAQVLPILLNQDEAYYKQVFKQTNGLLFPGGDNLLDPKKRTPMLTAAHSLYRLAVEANDRGDFYPIWGTCLGLELLSVLSSGKNVLDSCDATDVLLNMKFVNRGKLFEDHKNSNLDVLNKLNYAKMIVGTLEKESVSYHYHSKCLTDEGLQRAGLQNFYRPLAYASDRKGLKFISIFEAIEYPFYGVQFHPEKPPFEFTHGDGHRHVPHSRQSIEVSRYLADFFIRQAALNSHVVDPLKVQHELIYNSNPMYTAPLDDLYEQRYLFPFDGAGNRQTKLRVQGSSWQNLSAFENPDLLIEFLEHVPKKSEIIPEDVEQTDESRPEAADVPFIRLA